MNILLVQPPWPRPKKIKDPQKYFPFPLLKLAALYRKNGHNVHLMLDDEVPRGMDMSQETLFSQKRGEIPFLPDRILITTAFSYWFADYAKPCIEQYHALYPDAEVHIGGIHASLMPDVYRQHFPYAKIHVGVVPEAEKVEPAWELLPGYVKTQILRFSDGCIRNCRFCTGGWQKYRPYSWEEVSSKIRMNRLILNDNNFLAHPDRKQILKNLAEFRVNGKPINSIEIQGGLDARLLVNDMDIIPLLKACRVSGVRLAWDGGLELAPVIESCVEALTSSGYHMRSIRCYLLYNWDVTFDTVIKKLEYFAKWKLGPIHSRFRPVTLLNDGYVSQKKQQAHDEYYIHQGWTDRQVRVVGSLASDISRMARANISSLDEVRRYYNRPSVADTIRRAGEPCAA